jgi:S1-C subfamily serine protease
MKALLFVLVIAGFGAGQSGPPRKDIPAIAKAANGAIVSIVMSDKDGHAIAQGSGFLVSNDGVILTNYHVIAEGSSAVVKFPDGDYHAVDGVLASDKVRDIAVIKAHGRTFRALPLGNSDRVQVGEDVVAIGNPLSLESTVSNGIVSGIRAVKEEGGNYLQITAPISPGSSGGPLFNMAGEVIGITTMYLEGGENLNFAIPINDAKDLVLSLSTDPMIHDFPNEIAPVQAGTHTGDAPSPIASAPVQPPVEHAATAEQCEADARVWSSRPASLVEQLPYTELQTRALEMGDCYVPGAQDDRSLRNNLLDLAASGFYEWEMIDRMARYISRHDPQSQYISEHVPVLSVTEPPEPAPKQKQCQADVRAWSPQIKAGMADGISANELATRTLEMDACVSQVHGSDDPAVATATAYSSTHLAYVAITMEQLHAYLLRHNEWSQFMSEDAAGMR